MSTTIALRLEVLANNKIVVPGCEPTSAVSSDTLARSMDCGSALVDLDVALAAIPGSTVEFAWNYSPSGVRKKWFVLPPVEQFICPCPDVVDYYQILKELATDDVPETESFDYCDLISTGLCPSPGFENTPPPPQDRYLTEGGVPSNFGFLSYPPNWNADYVEPEPESVFPPVGSEVLMDQFSDNILDQNGDPILVRV